MMMTEEVATVAGIKTLEQEDNKTHLTTGAATETEATATETEPSATEAQAIEAQATETEALAKTDGNDEAFESALHFHN